MTTNPANQAVMNLVAENVVIEDAVDVSDAVHNSSNIWSNPNVPRKSSNPLKKYSNK